jgi:hypothetical protein
MEEFDRIGQQAFLTKYGFGPAQQYRLEHGGRFYDSKAIVAAAHGVEFGRPLGSQEFSGGIGPRGAVQQLRRLGFSVIADGASRSLPALHPGTVYSWAELGRRFGFAPGYLSAAGGMISRPAHDALLLITYPGARSFDYGDSWDGQDLIYTGRGKRGDQEYAGPNRDVAENARALHVFEPAGVRTLVYLGPATSVESWREAALDLDGKSRSVLRFRLSFDAAARPTALRVSRLPYGPHAQSSTSVLRSFDPQYQPKLPAKASRAANPEEIARLQEKAAVGHQRILVTLYQDLCARGWSDFADMRTAIDLWGRNPLGGRVIFEAKTIRPGRERARVRGGLAQLLEYRYAHGNDNDRLCLVTDAALTPARVSFLESLGIGVLVCIRQEVYPGSPTGRHLLEDGQSA